MRREVAVGFGGENESLVTRQTSQEIVVRYFVAVVPGVQDGLRRETLLRDVVVVENCQGVEHLVDHGEYFVFLETRFFPLEELHLLAQTVLVKSVVELQFVVFGTQMLVVRIMEFD